jgi:anthranilate synthase/aminodeoxychorismate synthase-like glutamine amidotransferase
MLLLIDNYDSFTYNLFQYLSELGEKVKVLRNNKVTIDEIRSMKPERIVISPGPGTPEKAGISNEIIKTFGAATPILGVCLGHQCIAHSFGGIVGRAGELKHGKTSKIYHYGNSVFNDMPNPFTAVRYHSLAVKTDHLPDCLEITAWSDSNIAMGLRHRQYPIHGVQFHPESIMTQEGKKLLRNFLKIGGNHDS